MAKETKSKVLSDEEILSQIKKLSEESQKLAAKQQALFEANLGQEDIDTDFDSSVLNDTANPDKSHRLYYTMMMALRNNLPQGKANEKLRRYVYDEKSLFLNRGNDKDERGIRGSDERQAYIPNFLQVALDMVIKWIAQGADPFNIYMEFRQLNEKMGYRKGEVGGINNFDDSIVEILKESRSANKKETN